MYISNMYNGRSFSETGSSFILAVDLDVSSKFGMQILIHLDPSSQTSAVTKAEPRSRFPILWPPFWKIDMMS